MVSARVVFLGTPEFAVPSFLALLEEPGVEVVGAITQRDRPAGRGRRLSQPPVKRVALERGVPLLQPARLRRDPEAAEFLRRLGPDLLVVAAYGQILPRPFFETPPSGALNVHASLLPRYRGASPIVHAILEGETESGVTIMCIDEGLDTGPTLARRAVPLDREITAGELEEKLARTGAALLLETIGPYLAGELRPRPQDESRATYAGLLRRADARVDWNMPADKIHDRIRAFNPWPAAFTEFRGESLKLWKSSPQVRPRSGPEAPGVVLEFEEDRLWVACADSALGLLEVQPANRRRMSVRDFANGFAVAAGQEFH